MKKIYFIIILFYFLKSNVINLNAQSYPDALSYMNYISEEYQKISKDMWDYTSAVGHGKSARKVENKRKELVSTVQQAKKRISSMPAYEQDITYRDSVVSYLQLSYTVLNNDYAKILDMEEIAEQSYDAMEAYLLAQELATKRLNDAGDMVEQEQRNFAKLHNINLIENKDKIEKKLQVASKVFKYYNKVYLVFFKSYKQEAYLLDAMQKNDVNAIEQNKNSLISISKESIKVNDTIKLYNNDPTLKIALKQLLDFYIKEASEKIGIIQSFNLNKENYAKIKSAFDAKPQSNRTQEDIDQFNKSVKEFNESVAKYNATIQELNNNRSRTLDNWNNSVTVYLDKHIPKNK